MLIFRRIRASDQPLAGHRRLDVVGIGLFALSIVTLVAVVGEYLISSGATIWLANAGWTCGATVAVIGVAAAMRRSVRSDRSGWALLLGGSVAWLVGQLFWDGYSATSFPASPTPADVCWLAFAVASAAGIHRLCRGRWRLAGFSVLELVPLIVAVSALVVALLWSDIGTSRLSGAGQATAVAYPIFYVTAVLVMVQSVLAGGLDLRRNRGMAVALVGMMLTAGGFILWSSQLLTGGYVVGANGVDGLWSVGLVLVGVGAWATRGWVGIRGSDQSSRRRGGVLPALTFMVLAAVQTAINAGDGGADLVLSGGLAAIGITLIAHAWVLRRSQDVLVARLNERERELRDVNRRLGEESRRDALTGLANRLSLDEDFAEIADLGKRTRQGFCLVLIDLDRFKNYNDDQGHQAGDGVLRLVAELLKQDAREDDRAYRYGGEELLLVLRDQGIKAGEALGERHRAELQCVAIAHRLNPPHGVVTFSAGIAASRPGETPEQVLHRADTALYTAKARGRNQVAVAAPIAESVSEVAAESTHRSALSQSATPSRASAQLDQEEIAVKR